MSHTVWLMRNLLTLPECKNRRDIESKWFDEISNCVKNGGNFTENILLVNSPNRVNFPKIKLPWSILIRLLCARFKFWRFFILLNNVIGIHRRLFLLFLTFFTIFAIFTIFTILQFRNFAIYTIFAIKAVPKIQNFQWAPVLSFCIPKVAKFIIC